MGDAAGGGLALVRKAAAWAHLGGGGRGGSRHCHCQVLGARCGGGEGMVLIEEIWHNQMAKLFAGVFGCLLPYGALNISK